MIDFFGSHIYVFEININRCDTSINSNNNIQKQKANNCLFTYMGEVSKVVQHLSNICFLTLFLVMLTILIIRVQLKSWINFGYHRI